MSNKKPYLLCIMDGFGHNPDSYGNAIAAANKPNLDRIMAANPMTFIGAWSVIGFQSADVTGVQIMKQMDKCAKDGCKDALDLLGPRADVEKIREEAAKHAPTDWELFPVAAPKEDAK